MLACVEGNLAPYRAAWKPQACVCVVLASGGYPGPYDTGIPIAGLGAAGSIEGVEVFHAGTELRDGRVVTSGGRVLTVSALGDTLEDARGLAYEAASRIEFEGKMFRRDIAEGIHKGAARERDAN
jgi:phosphoribosylamine--glycine ligase